MQSAIQRQHTRRTKFRKRSRYPHHRSDGTQPRRAAKRLHGLLRLRPAP